MIAVDPFALEIPATPEQVGTARAFVGALVRQLSAPDEVVEDVKLAVSEACTDAILALAGRGSVRIQAAARPDAVTLEIDAPGAFRDARGDAGVPALSATARLELIRSLFPGAELSEASGRARVLRFTVSLH